ncbi:hypothetical protein LXL04_006520 [Taraxacum kok-saghyz]
MQFLMGVNDSYDGLHPLPTVYKAYSMALSVKKHREIQINFTNPIDVSAMLARSSNYNTNTKKSF